MSNTPYYYQSGRSKRNDFDDCKQGQRLPPLSNVVGGMSLALTSDSPHCFYTDTYGKPSPYNLGDVGRSLPPIPHYPSYDTVCIIILPD
jgi:hypothetical protein